VDVGYPSKQSSAAASSASSAAAADGGSGGSDVPVGLSVLGQSLVRKIDPAEGAILGITHFNNTVASVLTYATQKGIVFIIHVRYN
jgi:hypothetical protein